MITLLRNTVNVKCHIVMMDLRQITVLEDKGYN